jgi:hypothetical protein
MIRKLPPAGTACIRASPTPRPASAATSAPRHARAGREARARDPVLQAALREVGAERPDVRASPHLLRPYFASKLALRACWR